MHKVGVIVHCALITMLIIITRIVFYCNYCFRRINHLAVKHHLHSSSDVREVVLSTVLAQEGVFRLDAQCITDAR